MDNNNSKEPIPLLSPIYLNKSSIDPFEGRQKYKEDMEMCYDNVRNSSLINSSISSIDPTNNQRLIRYLPPSADVFLTPTPIELDPTTIPRYQRPSPSAAAKAFLSATATDLLLDSRRRSACSPSSSRGSSPSPLSPIENLGTLPLRTPPGFVKPSTTPKQPKVLGEEVFVMDEIRVNAPSAVYGNRAVTRPPLDSSGMSVGHYKTEVCHTWVDNGYCRYGPKCQFAHGKEELRPARPPKSKPETCRTFALTGACTFGSKCRYSHPPHEAAKPTKMAMTMTMVEMEVEETAEAAAVVKTETEAEEMIAAVIGSSTADAEECISQVLNGLTRWRPRLPVFAEMCPE